MGTSQSRCCRSAEAAEAASARKGAIRLKQKKHSIDNQKDYSSSDLPFYEFASEVHGASNIDPSCDPKSTVYSITLTVVQGSKMKKMDIISKSDPYLVVSCGGLKLRSRVVHNTLNPVFNERFDFVLKDKPTHLKFHFYDRDYSSHDDFMGKAQLSLDETYFEDQATPAPYMWLPIYRKDKYAGEIQLQAVCRAGPIGARHMQDKLRYVDTLGLVSINLGKLSNLKLTNREKKQLGIRRRQGNQLNPVVIMLKGVTAYQSNRGVTMDMSSTANMELDQTCRAWIARNENDYVLSFSLYHDGRQKKRKSQKNGRQTSDSSLHLNNHTARSRSGLSETNDANDSPDTDQSDSFPGSDISSPVIGHEEGRGLRLLGRAFVPVKKLIAHDSVDLQLHFKPVKCVRMTDSSAAQFVRHMSRRYEDEDQITSGNDDVRAISDAVSPKERAAILSLDSVQLKNSSQKNNTDMNTGDEITSTDSTTDTAAAEANTTAEASSTQVNTAPEANTTAEATTTTDDTIVSENNVAGTTNATSITEAMSAPAVSPSTRNHMEQTIRYNMDSGRNSNTISQVLSSEANEQSNLTASNQQVTKTTDTSPSTPVGAGAIAAAHAQFHRSSKAHPTRNGRSKNDNDTTRHIPEPEYYDTSVLLSPTGEIQESVPAAATATVTTESQSLQATETEGVQQIPVAERTVATLDIHVNFSTKDTVERWFFKRLMEEFDIEETGSLGKEAFAALLSALSRVTDTEWSDEEAQQLFDRIDIDADGFLDQDELLAYLRSAEFQSKPFGYQLLAYLADGQFGARTAIMDLYKTVHTVGETRHGADVIAIRDGGNVTKDKDGLLVYDATTGLIVKEHIPGYVKVAMDLLYKSVFGSKFVSHRLVRGLLWAMTLREGSRMNSATSANQIASFVENFHIDTDEIERPLDEYKTFNEFFYRKLRPGARQIASPEDVSIAVSPADCRLTVFETVQAATSVWIKGKHFTIESLFGTKNRETQVQAPNFVGGSIMIARLAPQDYHRWHFAVSGKIDKHYNVSGSYFTVNPIAVRRPLNVYTENERVVVFVETEKFGTVAIVAIGATLVGSINITAHDDSHVNKGDEHGFFAFGGSTVLTIFQPGKIKFERDLLEHSSMGLETLVKMGYKVGRALGENEETENENHISSPMQVTHVIDNDDSGTPNNSLKPTSSSIEFNAAQ